MVGFLLGSAVGALAGAFIYILVSIVLPNQWLVFARTVILLLGFLVGGVAGSIEMKVDYEGPEQVEEEEEDE